MNKAQREKLEQEYMKKSTPFDNDIKETILDLQDLDYTLSEVEGMIKHLKVMITRKRMQLDSLKEMADNYKRK